jgi:hypothetical protein
MAETLLQGNIMAGVPAGSPDPHCNGTGLKNGCDTCTIRNCDHGTITQEYDEQGNRK